MTTDDRLTQLLDKQEITETLAAYCRAMDRIDVELARSVFHPDAVADYGAMFTGTGYEFAEFIAAVHPGLETHIHHLGSISITVDGDTAGSEAYVMARLRSRGADGTLTDIISHGRYVDRWQRRDGVWRISHRRYLHALDETRTVPAPLFPVGGSRDRTDPAYDVLDKPGEQTR
ncbi:nuclear transport factor 2 family protein [Nocardia testacea]|uniref:nuclear transport factor 2 family protein n=1 Tax=Nocardia testacea TaxID=248551 RepID=UPI003411DA60